LEEKREDLFMELKNKEEELELVSADLEDALYENETLKAENDKLKQELAENSKDLEDIKLENGEQKAEISQLKGKLYYSFDKPLPKIKPLPSLPKKRNTFQKLGTKIKTKYQKFQQLAEKKKQQTQQFIARIEVKANK
jgi:chromosome segregation ATPase